MIYFKCLALSVEQLFIYIDFLRYFNITILYIFGEIFILLNVFINNLLIICYLFINIIHYLDIIKTLGYLLL